MLENKYIVALLPSSQDKFIKDAHHFKTIAKSYLLGKKSLAHITLAQFLGYAEDYESLSRFLLNKKLPKVKPSFTGISHLNDKHDTGIIWVEYSIARQPDILTLQSQISTFLRQRGINLLNDDGNLYRPHLTLACIKADEKFPIPMKSPFPSPNFDLAIGKADEHGQFNELLKKF